MKIFIYLIIVTIVGFSFCDGKFNVTASLNRALTANMVAITRMAKMGNLRTPGTSTNYLLIDLSTTGPLRVISGVTVRIQRRNFKIQDGEFNIPGVVDFSISVTRELIAVPFLCIKIIFITSDRELKYLLQKMNDKLLRINRLSAKLEWESSTKPSRDIFLLKRQFSLFTSNWRNELCSRLDYYRDDKLPDARMIYLLCRGPIYSSEQARALTSVSDKLLTSYATREVCRMEMEGRKCYHGEPDLKTLMSESRYMKEN